ncbi:hypothetical protein [Candidatus Palauibacter sp.]|uniref:hypothetical protein n=1 Tax=Candidatus Palauibacter sp. TaxID=3101350 RepID=UPI003D0E04BB
MGAELIGIIAVGVALAGLILGTAHRHRDDMKGLRGEIRGLRGETRGEIQGLRGEMHELRGEVHAFRVEITERVARIEVKVFGGAAPSPSGAAGAGGSGSAK